MLYWTRKTLSWWKPAHMTESMKRDWLKAIYWIRMGLLRWCRKIGKIRKTESRLQITSALYWWEFVTYSVSLWGISGVLGKNITPYEFPCQDWRKALAEETNRFNLSNRPVYAVGNYCLLKQSEPAKYHPDYRLQTVQKCSQSQAIFRVCEKCRPYRPLFLAWPSEKIR